MRTTAALLAALLFLCTGGGCNGSGDEPPDGGVADGSGGRDGGGRDGGRVRRDGGPLADGEMPPTPDAGVPEARCAAPPLADVSSPDHVVGDGTPGSCTAGALQTAATAGGTIVFDCGSDPITITLSSVITFSEESVLDGGGLVTLSGGGATRILYLDSGYDTPTPRLTVQRLAFRDGQAPPGGEDTAQGGGAIYRDGGSLTVIDSSFTNNHAPSPGQDIAGGAIYGFGGGDTIISGCTFTNNAASDGGASREPQRRSHGHQQHVRRQLRDRHGRQPRQRWRGRRDLHGRPRRGDDALRRDDHGQQRGRDRRRVLPCLERSHRVVRDGPLDDRRQSRHARDRGQRRRALPRRAHARHHGEHDLAQPAVLQRRHLDQHVHRCR